MSAPLLREAAALMRERAEAAHAGRWFSVVGEDVEVRAAHWRCGDHDVALCEGSVIHEGNVANAAHIASWHPKVAKAVAKWLDHLGVMHEFCDDRVGCDWRSPKPGAPLPCIGVEHALTVARAYLGRDQ